jgi:ubiquitin-protein ligase
MGSMDHHISNVPFTQTNTPYHSVPFKLMVYFPDNYPYEKPTLKIESFERFFHPNISTKTGFICEDTLKSGHVYLTARDRINAFINLLAIPNP